MGTKRLLIPNSTFAISFIIVWSLAVPGSLSGQCANFLEGDTVMTDCGDSVTLTPYSPSLSSKLLEDFNDKSLDSGFVSNSNPDYSEPCKASPDNSPYAWFGPNSNIPRSIRTVDIKVDSSTQVCFDLRFAEQGNPSPCEGPDLPDEGVYLEFSTDSGSSWSKIHYFNPDTACCGCGGGCGGTSPSPFVNWDNYCFSLPNSVHGKNTRFRWRQPSVTDTGYDHWGLDDIAIKNIGSDTSLVYDWGNGISSRDDSSFLPKDTSDFSATIIDTVANDTCTAHARVGYRPLKVGIHPKNPVKCSSDSLLLKSGCDSSGIYTCDSSGVYNYDWSPSTALSDTASRTVKSGTDTPITYSLTVQDSVHGFCKSNDAVTVDTTSPPSPKILFDSTLCENELDTLRLAKNYASVVWNNTFTTSELIVDSSYGSPTQEHWVTVTDSNGCSASDTIQIQVVSAPDPNIIADSSYCINGTDTLTLSGSYASTLWNDSIAGDSLIVDKSYGSPSQVHHVVVTDSNGCSGSDAVQIWLDTVNTSVHVQNDTLFADRTGASYQWLACDSSGYSPISGATSQSFYPSTNGNYAVIVSANNCTDTSICKTSLPNSPWTNVGSGVPATFYSVHFEDSTKGWVATSTGQIYHTKTGGNGWTLQHDTSIALRSIHFVDDSSGWSVGEDGTVLSTNNGGSIGWSPQAWSVTSDLFSVHASDPAYAWSVGINGTSIHTSDGGTNWNAQNNGSSLNLEGVHFHNRDSGWSVGGSGTILRTSDGGSNWNSQTSGTSNDLADVQFVNDSVGWTVGDNGTILLSEDGGTSWTSQASGTNEDLEAVHFVNDSTGWIVGAQGTILYTNDGRAGWSSQADGSFHGLKDVHFTENGHGWVAGEGGTLLNFDRGTDDPTSIERKQNEALVKVYPNPVDERLRIEHQGVEGDLSFTLFNKLGQRLKTVRTADGSQGRSSLQVNGLEPGIYFLKVEEEREGKAVQERIHKIVVE